MKTNPTCAKAECPKEFPDNLNFCQLCGARLTAVVAVDPFKTVVASSSAKKEDDILFIPEPSVEPIDSMKTSVVSNLEIPEIPASAPSEPLPSPPRFDEPVLTPPDFGRVSTPIVENPPVRDLENEATLISSEMPNFDETFTGMPLPGNSPYRTPTDEPVSSPFEQPASNPFDLPAYEPPSFKDPEPVIQNDPFGSPFNSPATPFGQQNQMEQAWTPPPAPNSNWSNQGVGQNTPFQAPMVPGGQNQTLAIVSLVCGITSILCCGFLTGIPAIITGYMARNNADNDPNQYGGKTLATVGMVLGIISIVLTIVVVILQVLAGAFGRF